MKILVVQWIVFFARYVSIIKTENKHAGINKVCYKKSIKTRLYRSIKSEFITPNHKIGVRVWVTRRSKFHSVYFPISGFYFSWFCDPSTFISAMIYKCVDRLHVN